MNIAGASSHSQVNYQKYIYASSLSIAMIAMATMFFIISLVLSGVSLLPQTTLPFSGAYFVIGSFLVFIAAGILLINTLCNHYYLYVT